MNITTAELLLIASTIGGAIAWLLKYHADKSRENKELGKIDIESWGLLRGQVGEMEEKIVDLRKDNDELRKRIEILEEQVDVKDATIKKLDTRLTKILIYLSGLLKELDGKGVQYTKPDPGLLDTNPRIPPVQP